MITLLLQKWWGHWIRTCHNVKWCGGKIVNFISGKVVYFWQVSAHLFVFSFGLRQSSRVTWLMEFVFALEISCRKPLLLSTFSGFFVERSWFRTVCDWLISGAILFDICSFATMIDSTGAFSCIGLIKDMIEYNLFVEN